jgi:hypothetical protein
MKRKGGREAGFCLKMVSDVAINVYLLFNVAIVFSSKYFRFLFVKPSE